VPTVEVSHKAGGVRTSSKITDSYVASFPDLPYIKAFSIHSRHFQDHQRFFRTSSKVWQKGFPEVRRFSAMTSHKSLIAFQKRDGHTYIYIYIQHLLPSLATLRDPMPRAKALGNNVTL